MILKVNSCTHRDLKYLCRVVQHVDPAYQVASLARWRTLRTCVVCHLGRDLSLQSPWTRSHSGPLPLFSNKFLLNPWLYCSFPWMRSAIYDEHWDCKKTHKKIKIKIDNQKKVKMIMPFTSNINWGWLNISLNKFQWLMTTIQ